MNEGLKNEWPPAAVGLIERLEKEREDLLAENQRLRCMLEQKSATQSQIRVELPSKENGSAFYITSYKADDEERIAKELAHVIEMYVECLNASFAEERDEWKSAAQKANAQSDMFRDIARYYKELSEAIKNKFMENRGES